jgi:hypothetical protein
VSRSAKAGFVVLGLMAVGCGSSTAPPADDFVGTWHATKVEYVSNGGMGTVDIVALGSTVTLQLNADKTAVLTITPAGGAPQVTSGTWSNSIDVFNFTVGASNGWSWDYALSGGTLTLTGADSSYDFNSDNVQDDAKFNLTLTK